MLIEKISFLKKVLFCLCAVSLVFSACKKDEDEDDEANKPTIGATGGTGSGGSDGGMGVVTANINTVASGMVPDSLASDGVSLALSGDDPCADSEGFFDCQPVLIKLYLSIAKDMVGFVKEIMGHTTSFVNNLSAGSSGTHETDGTDGIVKIDYNVTDATKYKLLLHSSSGPFLWVSIDGSAYEIKMDQDNAPDDDSFGNVNVAITYTDATNYDVDVIITEMGCDSDDVRAPGNFNIKVGREDDVWSGKAMMYMPRWAYSDQDPMTCDDDPTTSSEVGMYTDFVGDDVNVTASLYMMKSTTAASGITDYPMSDFCTTYDDMCYTYNSQGYFGDPNTEQPVSTYGNPFCVTEDDATWNAACDDYATSDFSAASNWVSVSDVSELTVVVPSSL